MSNETTTLPSAERDGFWLRQARDAYSSSSTYFDTNVRNRIIQDIRQFQSEHPEGSKYFTDAYRLKSRLFRPKTRAAIRKNEATAAAAFFSTEDVVSVRPVDDNDPRHQAAAKMHQALLQYRLTRPHPHGLPWFLTCMGAYQEAQTCGIVASYQDWVYNPKKKLDRPECMLLPVENVHFDPAADWRDVVNSSPYLIIQWPMYVKDVRARMVPQEDGSTRWRSYSDAEILAATRTSDTIRLTREGKGTDSKSANTGLSDFSICWVHENIIEVNGEDVVFYTLGTERLLSEPTFVEERYPHGRPVAIGFSIVEAHKAYPSSTPSLTRDTQTEINDVANLRIDNVKLRLNKRYFAARGKNVDLRSLTRNIPSSVTLMDNPNTDVKVITTDDATASAYQEQDRLNLDFDDLSGAFSGSSVASNRQLNETVGGMNLLSTNANQVGEYQLRTFTVTWVEKVLRHFVVLEQANETDEMVLRIAGKNSGIDKLGFHEVTDELIEQDVILTVNVGTGAVNPHTQLERFMFAMGSLQKLLGQDFLKRPLTDSELEIAKEVFGKAGYKDGTRFFPQAEEGEEDPRITQLKQMVEQLQQALAAKNPPELVAAMAAEKNAKAALMKVEVVAKNVEAMYSAMQTAQTAVTVPGVTAVADAIIQSAGFQDQDQAPIYPAVTGEIPAQIEPPDKNTSPMFPARPDSGMMAGMEAQGE